MKCLSEITCVLSAARLAADDYVYYYIKGIKKIKENNERLDGKRLERQSHTHWDCFDQSHTYRDCSDKSHTHWDCFGWSRIHWDCAGWITWY